MKRLFLVLWALGILPFGVDAAGDSRIRRGGSNSNSDGGKKSKKKSKKNKKSSSPLLRGKKSKNASVGIVGAGMAGLFSAAHLQDLGFNDIHIYEKEDKVGGVIITQYLPDGRPFDGTIMWVPDSSVYGPGIPPFLQRFLDDYDQTLSPGNMQGTVLTPDGNDMDTNNPYVPLHPAVALSIQPPFSLTRTQVVATMVQTFSLSKNHAQCIATGGTCTSCGICASQSELPETFAARTGSFFVMLFMMGVVNTLGAGPAGVPYNLRTADFVLKVSYFWIPDIISQTFKFFSVTTNELELFHADEELIAIMNQNNFAGPAGYLNLQDGFQNFADSIAEDFDVLLNTEVHNVSKEEDTWGWNIETDIGTFHHDIVVLANPPRIEADKGMFPAGTVHEAMSYLDMDQPPSQGYLHNVTKWVTETVPPKSAWIRMFALNEPTPWFPIFEKRYADSSAVLIGGTVPPHLSGDAAEPFAQDQLKSLTSEDTDLTQLVSDRIMFPPTPLPADQDVWEDLLVQAAEMRKEGLFLHGEHVCGTGLPQLAACLVEIFSILDHDEKS